MKVWKIVSGVLSILISLFVVFQSFFAGAYNILTGNGQSSGTAGVVVAIVMFTGGIVALATSSGSRGGDAAIAILCGVGALTGFFGAGIYLDLYVWASWCLLCAVLALVDFVRISRYDDEDEDVVAPARPTANMRSGPATFQDVILEPDPRRRDAAIDALPERHAKNYLKQAMNVLVPRHAAAGAGEDDSLVRTLIAILAVVGVLLIGVVGLGIFLSIDKNDRTASSALPAESKNIQASEPVQTTPPAAANSLTVGDSTILGHWEIAVTDFYYTDRIETSPYSAYTPDEGNQYAVVAARITNNGTESDTFLPSISMTNDVRTAVHYADEYVYSSSYLLGITEDLHDSSLNPLTSKDGFIAFAVPDVVANSEESLSVTFSAGRDEVTFRLR